MFPIELNVNLQQQYLESITLLLVCYSELQQTQIKFQSNKEQFYWKNSTIIDYFHSYTYICSILICIEKYIIIDTRSHAYAYLYTIYFTYFIIIFLQTNTHTQTPQQIHKSIHKTTKQSHILVVFFLYRFGIVLGQGENCVVRDWDRDIPCWWHCHFLESMHIFLCYCPDRCCCVVFVRFVLFCFGISRCSVKYFARFLGIYKQ